AFGHRVVGTEHLLLGLMHVRDGVAATVLESRGVSIEAARRQIERHAPLGLRSPNGHVPLSRRMTTVLELSRRESRRLGDDHIGTGHLLLGLVREGEGLGAQVLAELGADLDRICDQVLASVAPEGQESAGLTGPAIEDRLAAVEERLEAVERMLENHTPGSPDDAGADCWDDRRFLVLGDVNRHKTSG
ncbi:MAG: hypothetical protein J2P23_15085, partial [Microlunatus sp.]|nr:hypothetical protein [Microlunatus sp.]